MQTEGYKRNGHVGQRGASFYRPDEIPTEGQGKELDKLIEIRRFHEYYEMKRWREPEAQDVGKVVFIASTK